jgi:hypothetical protein
MPVLYDSKRILPVSSIGIEKEYVRSESSAFRRVKYVVTANGSLVATKGSPLADGTWWTSSGEPPDISPSEIADFDNRLAILRNKKGALDALFATRGKLFEIQPFDGTSSVKFVPRVRNISYTQGSPQIDWLEKIPFTIVMETDEIDFGTFVLSANEEQGADDCDETWNIEPNDDKSRTYKVVHSVSASANDEYDTAGTGNLLRKGWLVAKEDKVVPNLGFDIEVDETPSNDVDVTSVSILGSLSGYEKYNYVKTENIDETNGKYSVTETWILYDGGPYLEDYNISIVTSAQDGGTSVSIDGTITGYSTGTGLGIGDRFSNAETGWSTIQPLLITRAQTYSGATLNASFVDRTIGKNPNSGVITYNYKYTDQASTTISGALTETVTISDSLPTPVIAKHICPARTIGPVLQDVLTQTESRRTLNIEIQMPKKTQSFTPSEPDVTSIISEYTPTAEYSGPYLDKNEKVWVRETGRYSRTISWLWV